MRTNTTDQTILPPGSPAPRFSLPDSSHSRLSLDDLDGGPVVLVFHVADWHPVADEQLLQIEQLRPVIEGLGASVVAISVDATWSHDAYARAWGLGFPLLADDAPIAAVASAYGVYASETGRSRRALVVIDRLGIVRWSAVFPDALAPGVEGILDTLEGLRTAPTDPDPPIG